MRRFFHFLVLLIILTACTSEPVSVPVAPIIDSFIASKMYAQSGETINLSWQVTSATQITLEGIGEVKGKSLKVKPTATTTYRLIAVNGNVSTSKDLTITIGQAPIIKKFVVMKPAITKGDTATLLWEVEGTDDTEITLEGFGTVTGKTSLEVTLEQDTTFSLKAHNRFGSNDMELVATLGLAISTFETSDTTIISQTPTTLYWQIISEKPTQLVLKTPKDSWNVTNLESFTVLPDVTTTFTLEADNGTSKTSQTIVLTVGTPPDIEGFTANDTTVLAGSSVNLTWQIENAQDIYFGNQKISENQKIVQPDQTTQYFLRAENDFGESQEELIIEVGEAPAIFTFSGDRSVISPNATTTIQWDVNDAENIIFEGQTQRTSKDAYTVQPNITTTYHLQASNKFGESQKEWVVKVAQPITLLIAGQSNASGRGLLTGDVGIPEVRMLGNDYVWKEAREPLDSSQGQLDLVSLDESAGTSFGLTLGKSLFRETQRPVYLIPSAKGQTSSSEWLPDNNLLNRSTLLGSTVYRAKVSAGQVASDLPNEGREVSAVIWFQGENDANSPEGVALYQANTETIFKTFKEELNAPIIYAQIGDRIYGSSQQRAQMIRELQRQLETDYGLNSIANAYMVVTHDLPLKDNVHLSSEGQHILGERIALAYREHILGEAINGTGPRLLNITQEGPIIKVRLTRPINHHASYEDYFNVFINGLAVDIQSLGRDPNDSTSILITLEDIPLTASSVSISYTPTGNRSLNTQLMNVVKDQDGLPLPAFGPIAIH